MEIIIGIIALLIGGFAGKIFADHAGKRIGASAEAERKKIEAEIADARKIADAEILRAKTEAESAREKVAGEIESERKKLLKEADAEAKKIIEEADAERKELKTAEAELRRRTEKFDERIETKEKALDEKVADVEKMRKQISAEKTEVDALRKKFESAAAEQDAKLAEIAKLKRDEAREILLNKVESEIGQELEGRIAFLEDDAKKRADEKARNVIAGAIQRLASDVTSESTTTIVEIPSDDIKGRIIGREGRNINAFEKITGVDVIVDDTPGAIVLSGFDLVRRTIAKSVLEKLIADGRINPPRIEEEMKKAEEEMGKKFVELGDAAVLECGLTGIPPEVVKILGRLNFRTSYGQNVLRHSVQCAHLAQIVAAETGADPDISKKGALLHDIGKALSHEIEGSHATIGRDIGRKYGLDPVVVNCIAAHHEDEPMETPEAFIVAAVDAISGARPGARRESLEAYIKRLKDLENIATTHKGVEKAYAVQAGREVRVMVRPEEVDDLQAKKLAHEVAREIETTMTYPGQIKVNVFREVRAEELAK